MVVVVEEDAALAAAFTWGLVLAGVVGRRTQREVRPLHATASLSEPRTATRHSRRPRCSLRGRGQRQPHVGQTAPLAIRNTGRRSVQMFGQRARHLKCLTCTYWGRGYELRVRGYPGATWGILGEVSCFRTYKRYPDPIRCYLTLGVRLTKWWQRCPRVNRDMK